MKKLLLLLIPSLFLNAQVGLDYYLGDLNEYNKSIPTPLSVIGAAGEALLVNPR